MFLMENLRNQIYLNCGGLNWSSNGMHTLHLDIFVGKADEYQHYWFTLTQELTEKLQNATPDLQPLFGQQMLVLWGALQIHTKPHTLTGHQAMSRPAKKYPLRVFLLTLHDDWQRKQLQQSIHTRCTRGEHTYLDLRLSPRCPQRGLGESRLKWR